MILTTRIDLSNRPGLLSMMMWRAIRDKEPGIMAKKTCLVFWRFGGIVSLLGEINFEVFKHDEHEHFDGKLHEH